MSRASLRPVHLAVLGALFVAPGLAVRRFFGTAEFWLLLGWAALMSAAAYAAYALDKRRAATGGPRISELQLHALACAGGWPGAFLAQHQLRHKCAKLCFQAVYWLIVAAHQFVAVDFRLGWQWTRAVWAALGAAR